MHKSHHSNKEPKKKPQLSAKEKRMAKHEKQRLLEAPPQLLTPPDILH